MLSYWYNHILESRFKALLAKNMKQMTKILSPCRIGTVDLVWVFRKSFLVFSRTLAIVSLQKLAKWFRFLIRNIIHFTWFCSHLEIRENNLMDSCRPLVQLKKYTGQVPFDICQHPSTSSSLPSSQISFTEYMPYVWHCTLCFIWFTV